MLETPNIPYQDEPDEWNQYSDAALAGAWYQEAALYSHTEPPEPPSGNSLFQAYLDRAGQGDGCAQYALGKMYFCGVLTQANPFQAALWFSKASMGGNPFACYELAKMCEFGAGMKADQKSAMELYRKAYAVFRKIQENNPNQAVSLKIDVIRKHNCDEEPLDTYQTRIPRRSERLMASTVRPVRLMGQIAMPKQNPQRRRKRRPHAKHRLAVPSGCFQHSVVPECHVRFEKPAQKPEKEGERKHQNPEEKQPVEVNLVCEPDTSLPAVQNSDEREEKQEVQPDAAPSVVPKGPVQCEEPAQEPEREEERKQQALEEKQPVKMHPACEPNTQLPAVQNPDEREEKQDSQTETDSVPDTSPVYGYQDPQTFRDALRILENFPAKPGETCAVLDDGKAVFGEIDRMEIYTNTLLISVAVKDIHRPYPVSMVGKTIFIGPECYQQAQKAAQQN